MSGNLCCPQYKVLVSPIRLKLGILMQPSIWHVLRLYLINFGSMSVISIFYIIFHKLNTFFSEFKMEFIDHIIYINLDRRTDRRQEIEEEFRKYNIPPQKITRYSAIDYSDRPEVACAMSHVGVLTQASIMPIKNVLILEDDFEFLENPEESLRLFFTSACQPTDWDVVMLAYDIKQARDHNSLVGQVIESSNAAAYLIRKHAIPGLIKVISDNIEPLLKTREHWNYMSDIVWSQLMKSGKWFYFIKPLGHQRKGYSDLSRMVIEHESIVNLSSR